MTLYKKGLKIRSTIISKGTMAIIQNLISINLSQIIALTKRKYSTTFKKIIHYQKLL